MSDQRGHGDETIDVSTLDNPNARIPGKKKEWGSSTPPRTTAQHPAASIQYSEDPRERAFQLSQSETKVISGYDFVLMLERAGILRVEDRIRRVVIDAAMDGPVTMFIERFGDTRLLALETTLQGTRIDVVAVEDLPSR